MEAIQQATRTKSVFELERRMLRADETPGWALSRAAPLLDEKGELAEWLGTVANVTARTRYEERQRLLLNELNHRVKTPSPRSNPLPCRRSATRQPRQSGGMRSKRGFLRSLPHMMC